MSKPTKSDQIAAALLTLGAREVLPSPSKRYRCFECAEGLRYWVGRCGAFRFGATISTSHSIDSRGYLQRAINLTEHCRPTEAELDERFGFHGAAKGRS